MLDEPDQLEELTSTLDEFQAAMIVAALKDNGIPAVAEGGLTSGFRAETPGLVHVMVRIVDLDRAKAALDDYYAANSDIDWDQVDVGEQE